MSVRHGHCTYYLCLCHLKIRTQSSLRWVASTICLIIAGSIKSGASFLKVSFLDT